MNHRYAVLMLMIVLAAMSLAAQSPAGESDEKTFMWRVERGETTLYLLGSVHALKENAYPLPPVIDAAFDEVDVLVFEIDLGDMTAAAIKMMAAGSLEKGQTLEQVVGPQRWSEFEALISDSGINASLFNGMKPWMAALTVTAFELTKHGYLSTAGLDTHLSLRAEETGKEKLALETAEFQVSLFAELTPEESLAFLHYTLTDLDTIIPEMDSLYVDWRAGNVEPVEEMLFDGFEEFPEVFKRMVTDRNRTWLPQIEELLAGERDAMVVVGSMHLVGEGGIVNLLREKGYTVEQQ